MGSALESAFTAPGTNARRGQEQRQRNAISILERYLQAYGDDPEAMARRDLADEARTRAAMTSLANSYQRAGDPEAQARLAAATALRSIGAGNARAAGMARGAGLDRATVAALGAGDPLLRARAMAGARSAGRQQAMANQQGALQSMLGVLNLNGSRMGNLFNANAAIQSQAPVQVGPSPLAAFGALAGQAVSFIPRKSQGGGNG